MQVEVTVQQIQLTLIMVVGVTRMVKKMVQLTLVVEVVEAQIQVIQHLSMVREVQE